jgi:D-alanyl-D-alanine dipeptidase
MKQVAAYAIVLCSALAADAEPPLDAAHCRQCILVLTPSWSASAGTLVLFQRNGVGGDWEPHGKAAAVVVGRKGMAPERGFTAAADVPRKREGDLKAPAGIFSLGQAFGYAAQAQTRMPFLPLTRTTLGIDDPRSRYYNQLIDGAKASTRDWHSAEVMRRSDVRYKWGLFVNYNVPPEPGAGSCIFLHVWLAPGVTTVGCTAMSEQKIVGLLRWLDPAKNPRLVQMPRPIYEKLQTEWHLPHL